jgi:hypothetical protein
MPRTDPNKPWITYHTDLTQGSDEWLAARCGIITASEMKLILTPTLKTARNEKTRAHLYELLAQRITQYVEPRYIGDDMLRGQDDEIYARMAYSEHYAPIDEMGFITSNKWGFTIGYSPDGLVGDDGLWECKSRVQKYQVQTVIEHIALAKGASVPADYVMQLQTGLLVADREWIDFTSYCGGLPMVTIRVYPDEKIQAAIIEAATEFEAELQENLIEYRAALITGARLIETERRIIQEMYV